MRATKRATKSGTKKRSSKRSNKRSNKRSSKRSNKRSSKRSNKRSSKRSSKRSRRTRRIYIGGENWGQPTPAASGGQVASQNNANANDQNNMIKMLKGGKGKRKQFGGSSVALCATNTANGANGFGYRPENGCLGPVPSAQDPNAQSGLITAAYSSAVNAANAAFDNAQ